jgi:hypothetical protein
MISSTVLAMIIQFCSGPNTGYAGPRECVKQSVFCTALSDEVWFAKNKTVQLESEALFQCLTVDIKHSGKTGPRVRK